MIQIILLVIYSLLDSYVERMRETLEWDLTMRLELISLIGLLAMQYNGTCDAVGIIAYLRMLLPPRKTKLL